MWGPVSEYTDYPIVDGKRFMEIKEAERGGGGTVGTRCNYLLVPSDSPKFEECSKI